ncbi:MAG: hypothetical protein JO093_04320 [Acidobacteria bacterium]|nr:hypothetical protein [Acidobacteriota bacterium]MBV9069635.1 hypothetical protein [Acidobacteriota bacterium]MBV9184816.1 hypothetical protein [Acidobacteriota bacterium]
MDNDNSLSLRDTADGLIVRAALLTLGGLFIGGWITALAMKVAGKAIHLLVLLGAGLILTGLGTYEVKKVQRRWRRDDISNVA